MKNICVLLFNLRHVIHISSFGIVKLLCCEGHFSSITFIDAKTKYRSPYLLDVSQAYFQNHIRMSLGCPGDVSEGRPEDVGRTRPFQLQTRPLGDVLVTPAGDVPWRYIKGIMVTSSGRYIGTSSGRHISTFKGRRQRTSLGSQQGTSLGVTQRAIWGRPQDVFWRSPQDVLES